MQDPIREQDQFRFVEDQLERSRSRFRGLTQQLDGLRRYHRRILHDLPLGEADPRARLDQLKERTAELKRSQQAVGTDLLMQATDWLPEEGGLSYLRIENLSIIIMMVFNTAGNRAIMIGIALGIASTSLKTEAPPGNSPQRPPKPDSPKRSSTICSRTLKGASCIVGRSVEEHIDVTRQTDVSVEDHRLATDDHEAHTVVVEGAEEFPDVVGEQPRV